MQKDKYCLIGLPVSYLTKETLGARIGEIAGRI